MLHNDFGITDDWLLETPETNRQTDGDSCGVFVCWFATQIINGQSLTANLFNPLLFRKIIYETIVGNCLRRQMFANNHCLQCIKAPIKADDWIQCDKCEQWWHCSCVGISLADAHQQAFVCQVINSSAIVDKDHI